MPSDVKFMLVPYDTSSFKFFGFGPGPSGTLNGFPKLINIFIKYLMTSVGSDPHEPNYGTSLVSLLGSNITPRDAQDIAVLAVRKTVTDLRGSQQGKRIPDNERLAGAEIIKFYPINDGPGFALHISLTNAAGQTLAMLLPSRVQ